MKIRSFVSNDTVEVIKLWTECQLTRAWNNPRLDIERKLAVDADLFIVGELNGTVVATAMFGYEGHRGWVNYLAVSQSYQRKGFARELMAYGEQLLLAKGCPKINLQVRATNTSALGFYEKLGYANDEVISLGKRLIPD